jgi:hypothetical protein
MNSISDTDKQAINKIYDIVDPNPHDQNNNNIDTIGNTTKISRFRQSNIDNNNKYRNNNLNDDIDMYTDLDSDIDINSEIEE